MNRLSAIDSFAPAFARVRAMLFSPFRLGAWLKIGLIGLLGGGAVVAGSGVNYHIPANPRNVPHGDLPHNAEDILRAIRNIHLADYFHIVVIVIGVIVVFALIFFTCSAASVSFCLIRWLQDSQTSRSDGANTSLRLIVISGSGWPSGWSRGEPCS